MLVQTSFLIVSLESQGHCRAVPFVSSRKGPLFLERADCFSSGFLALGTLWHHQLLPTWIVLKRRGPKFAEHKPQCVRWTVKR